MGAEVQKSKGCYVLHALQERFWGSQTTTRPAVFMAKEPQALQVNTLAGTVRVLNQVRDINYKPASLPTARSTTTKIQVH